jgi:hypothetical protein
VVLSAAITVTDTTVSDPASGTLVGVEFLTRVLFTFMDANESSGVAVISTSVGPAARITLYKNLSFWKTFVKAPGEIVKRERSAFLLGSLIMLIE